MEQINVKYNEGAEVVDIKPALDALKIEEVQYLMWLSGDEWGLRVKEMTGIDADVDEYENPMYQDDEGANNLGKALIKYVLERIATETKEVRERAELAFNAYEEAGGATYSKRGSYSLSVNVKNHSCLSVEVPEFKDDDALMQQVYDWEQSVFWEFDMNDGRENDDGYFGKVDFPKVYGGGRSSGYVLFDGTENEACALSAANKPGTWSGGSSGSTSDGGIEDAVESWGQSDPTDPDVCVEDLESEYVAMAEMFESATKWVEYVKAAMAYRIKNVQGKNLDWLRLHIDNYRYELFDYINCTIVVKDGEFTISWPQHARKFDDVGGWMSCQEKDEGAQSHERWEGDTGYYRRRVLKDEKSVFSFTVDKKTFVEILAPEIVVAQSSLAKIGK